MKYGDLTEKEKQAANRMTSDAGGKLIGKRELTKEEIKRTMDWIEKAKQHNSKKDKFFKR